MAPSTSSEDKIRHTGQCGSKAMAAQTLFRTILWFHVFPDLFLVHLHDILLLSDHHPCELYMRHFFLFFFYMFHFSLLRVNYSSKQDIRIGPFPETICLYNSCFKKNSTKPCPVLYLKLGSKRTMDMTGVTAHKNTGFTIGFCDSCPSSPWASMSVLWLSSWNLCHLSGAASEGWQWSRISISFCDA